MNIGIDIDGVLTNDDDCLLDTITKYVFENNLEGLKRPYEYEYGKVNWDQSILDDYREKYFWDYCQNEPARKYASEVIKKLKDEGNNIYIITSRHFTIENTKEGEKSREIVKEWLKKNKIIYDEIYFSPDKTKEIDTLKIDIMIEDSPETIPTFIKHTHIFCYDCRYNRNLKLDNMTRVFSWYDIYSKIKEIENKNKIIIFDWGGVIESHKEGEYSIDKAIINLIKHFNSKEDEKTIVERYHAQSVEDITYHIYLENDKWFQKIEKEFNLECNSEEFYDYYIKEFDKIEYYKDVVEFAHSLKDRCKIAILSNLGSLDKQRLDKQVDLKKFNYVWLSFELNCRKPKEKIYEIVENDCKIEPKNILFIDDSKENIEVAKSRCWNTCLATGHELNIIKEKVNEFLNK